MYIEQIKFIETSPYSYQLSFLYDGNNLQTGNIDKQTTQADLVDLVRAFVNDFDVRRAKTNYDALKAAYDGKSVNI